MTSCMPCCINRFVQCMFQMARAYLFVQLGEAVIRLVGTASHLAVIATDSSDVHSKPLDSPQSSIQAMCAARHSMGWHCQTFKQCAHPAIHSVGTAKHSYSVRSQRFNRLAMPSNPSAQPATESFSIAIHSNRVQSEQQSFARHSVGWH
jgi:hypothetical protein